MAGFGFHTTGNEVVDAFAENVRGKTFLVTGPSEGGIGAETVTTLARATPRLLLLAGRSRQKIQPVIDQVKEQHPEVPVDFVVLDLSSQASVRAAVQEVKTKGNTIDVLINNAAIMACPFSRTKDGIEMQFGTNHIGPFLFSNLLLKNGLVSPNGRIVNVNSSASVRRGIMILPNFEDLTYGNGTTYNPWLAYSVSKSAGMLYTRSLAQFLKPEGITALSLNPGSIESPLQRFLTPELVDDAVAQAKKSDPSWKFPEQKSMQEGCSTQLRAALDPALDAHSGAFLDDCQPIEYAEHTEVYGNEEKVWALSERLVGEKFDF